MSDRKLARSKQSLQDMARSLQRDARKHEQQHLSERAKLKRAVESGSDVHVKMHAENAVSAANERDRCLRLLAQVNSTVSSVSKASSTKQVEREMAKVTKALSSACRSISPEHVARTMHDFESASDNIEMSSQIMSASLEASNVSTTSSADVRHMIADVGEEYALDPKSYCDYVRQDDYECGARRARAASSSSSQMSNAGADEDEDPALIALRNAPSVEGLLLL